MNFRYDYIDESLPLSSTEDPLSSDEEGAITTIVTAKPAIVLEDQSDSLSYIYDEIESKHTASSSDRGNLYHGGGSVGTGLYESIAGSILNLARFKAGEHDSFSSKGRGKSGKLEDLYSICDKTRKLSSR